MQEESGELACSERNGVLVWSCPLCQQGQTDRDALALHLTRGHSVLPACLDRLLETAVPVDCTGEDNVEDKAENDIDAPSPQQKHLEISKTPSDPSEADMNTEGPNQAAALEPNESWVKPASCHEKEVEGEESGDPEETEGSLEPNLERTELSDSKESENGSSNAAADKDGPDAKSSATVSGDPSLERFLDPNCPFKCHTCLESFTSKSALSLHYCSPNHLQRIRTVWEKQGGGNNSCTSIQPNAIRPFRSSKPYQCAVCRVSYNHAITLESHLKSVLHQTRSRNSALYQNRTRKCSSGAPGNSGSKGAGNGVTATSSAVSSGGDTTPTTSASTGNCSNAASLAAPATMTKEEEQMKAHPVLSLLSSPVASAQAVSAFLTLLTSSSPSLSPSLLPSLYTVSAGAAPGTPAPQLMPQQQLMPLMPLFLNGLQAPSPNAEPGSPILTQPVSVLGLNAAQQALLAQRLGCLQSLGLAVGNPAAVQASAEEQETRDAGEEEEMVEESHSPLQGGKTEEEEDRCGKGSMSEEFEHGEQAGSNMSVDEEAEGKTVSEELCGETIQPDLNSPIASNKVPDDSPSPGNVSLPSNTSLSPIHLNLTLSPDTTPQKSHTDTSQSPSSNPSPNHSSRHSPSSAGAEHKPNFARPGRLNAIPALNPQATACSNANVKPPNPNPKPRPGPPAMSEFQHQVLWAFLESRSEADAASPPQEDCEALSLEVGLEVEEVRRWFSDAWEARERAKLGTEHAGCKASRKNPDAEDPERATDEEPEEGDGVLTIVESEGGDSPARHSGAMDLSSSRGRGKEQESEDRGGDSDKEEFYTSVIVTDEESRDSSAREEPVSPMRVDRREPPAHKKDNCGGKVLRSSTVFLSDAEDDEDDEEGGTQRMKRKRKMEMENEEADIKRRRQDPDVDLELEAQADPPAPLSISLEQQGLPRISGSNILHSLPLSLSLAPFATQFISPYVLQLPASAVGLGINALEENRGKVPSFTNPPAITRYSGPFSDPLNAPPPASHTPPSRFLPNGGEYESALDLSIGKNHSATTSSSTSASIKEAIAQRDRLLDGLGFKPTTVGVPGAGGLIVVRVKPEHALAIPSTTNSSTVNISSNPKTNTFFVRKAEQISKTLTDRARIRDQEREREREKDNKSPKPQPFKDMRRSRTIIHTEQLDVLYGCYFKDPNPGKHEFEQIADWVHLPKKVVQIWFQNMRARERKGEVRFISDGTLAAVGKPLIKFTWPLTSPIFSSRPKSSPSGGGGVTKLSAASSPTLVHPKTKPEMEQLKEKDKAAPFVPKPKLETQTPTTVKVKLLPKVKAATAAVPEGVLETQPPLPYSSLKCKREKEEQKQQDEEEVTDEEEEEHVMDKIRPGATNRMTPKQSASTSKPNASGSQKHNGLNYWSPKGPFKINTLTREQLGLSAARTPVVSPPAPVPAPAPAAGASAPRPIAVKPSQADGGFVHHTTPRRPRTHLSSLQLSILQSCYETCAHPNALECETLGTELGLPLKVVQIWFQNTRAKEKRWRLQQEKQFPGATDSKKVEFRAGSYLQYSALRANRPILPKPVHLTEVDPATPPVPGQPAGNETLRGRCEVCGVAFESRSAGRAHVFSPRHLATLRATNFGQPPSLVTGGSAAGSGSGSGSGASPLSPSSSLPISTS